MSELFILQNQDKLFLGRQKEWLDGRDPASLYKTPHKDEAVNQVFEISSKDYTQRIKVVSCRTNEKGLPVIESELLPDAQPATASLFSTSNTSAEDTDSAAEDEELPEDADAAEDLDAATATDDLADEHSSAETESEDGQHPLL